MPVGKSLLNRKAESEAWIKPLSEQFAQRPSPMPVVLVEGPDSAVVNRKLRGEQADSRELYYRRTAECAILQDGFCGRAVVPYVGTELFPYPGRTAQ